MIFFVLVAVINKIFFFQYFKTQVLKHNSNLPLSIIFLSFLYLQFQLKKSHYSLTNQVFKKLGFLRYFQNFSSLQMLVMYGSVVSILYGVLLCIGVVTLIPHSMRKWDLKFFGQLTLTLLEVFFNLFTPHFHNVASLALCYFY